MNSQGAPSSSAMETSTSNLSPSKSWPPVASILISGVNTVAEDAIWMTCSASAHSKPSVVLAMTLTSPVQSPGSSPMDVYTTDRWPEASVFPASLSSHPLDTSQDT